MYSWRRFLLRCFGAQVGKGVIVRPTVRITYPWKVVLDDYVWVGDHAELYSLGPITIGRNSVVSQNAYLCTGGHDYSKVAFSIFAKPIVVGEEVWIAADVFVAPGVNIGSGAVVGARSNVFKDVPECAVVMGSPAVVIKYREPSTAPNASLP